LFLRFWGENGKCVHLVLLENLFWSVELRLLRVGAVFAITIG
jgi:hypothetical protein